MPVFLPLFLLFCFASTKPSPSTLYLLFWFLLTEVPLCLMFGSFFCLSKCDFLNVLLFEEPDFSWEKDAVEIPTNNKRNKNNFFIKQKLNNLDKTMEDKYTYKFASLSSPP